MEDFNAAIALDPSDAVFYLYRGLAQEAMDNTSDVRPFPLTPARLRLVSRFCSSRTGFG
jgi:hypothetical protein